MEDLKTTNIVLEADKDDFMEGFLAMCAMPMIPDPKWDAKINHDPQPMVPEYTPENWLDEWNRRNMDRAYIHGKTKLAAQTVTLKKDIIQPIPKLNVISI